MHFFTTLLLYYYPKYIIFLLQKYLFWLFFKVENKVVVMWSDNTLCCSCDTLKTVLELLLCCHWPMRSRQGQWHARSPLRTQTKSYATLVRGGRLRERGAGLVRVNNHLLMVSLACAEKPPPSAVWKSKHQRWELICLKRNISLTYKLKQINIAIMFIFIKIYNIIGIKK